MRDPWEFIESYRDYFVEPDVLKAELLRWARRLSNMPQRPDPVSDLDEYDRINIASKGLSPPEARAIYEHVQAGCIERLSFAEEPGVLYLRPSVKLGEWLHEQQAGEAEIGGGTPAKGSASGYLGLIVDEGRREITREGFDCLPVKLGPAEWHTFIVAYRAGDWGATTDQWENGYPAEQSGRANAKNRTKEKLKRLGVTFKRRSLKLVSSRERPENGTSNL